MSRLKHFVPTLIWATVIFVLSVYSVNSVEKLEWSGVLELDKVGHFISYGILSFLISVGMKGYNRMINSRVIFGTCIFLSAIYGICMECIQYGYFKDRHFEVLDIIANIIGSFIGAIFFLLFKNYLKWIFR